MMSYSFPDCDRQALVELIQAKLDVMEVIDRNDLRTKMSLQRCLAELRQTSFTEAGVLQKHIEIPMRGRHKKMSALLSESA